MKTTNFNELQQEFKKNNPEKHQEIEKNIKKRSKQIKTEKQIYIKDKEDYVKKINENELTAKHTVITEQEWSDLSGETYYKVTFGHGGARKNSGRKALHRNISKRITVDENDLIEFLRHRNLNPSEAKKKLAQG